MTTPKKIDDGGPVFPCKETMLGVPSDAPESVKLWLREFKIPKAGLTKREYFAGLAMQGILSNPYYAEWGINNPDLERIAVEKADALLAELSKTGGGE